MTLPESSWVRYINRLNSINKTAARKFEAYLNTHDVTSKNGRKAALDYAAALVLKYGEGAAAVSCEMYDAVAAASGALLPAAEPAAVASYGEVAKTINGIMKTSQNAAHVASGVERLVKQAGADTTLQNARRDGAEFAWVPHGDTCSFCLMLASNGWQKASKKTIKGDHAEHIHANCDCTFAVRFDSRSNVAGYDPDKYREIYDSAEGDTWKEKLNSMRRDNYAQNAGKIRQQKREAYEERSLKKIKDNAKLISEAISKQATESKSSVLVDAIIDNHESLQFISPADMKAMLEANGFDVLPLGNRSKHAAQIPFEEGGGFRAFFGGDGYLQYHPEGGIHKIAYWKINNGERGKHWYDKEGNECFFGK